MSKTKSILVFSDFHAHNFKFGSKRVTHPSLSGFYNSRLIDCLSALREMRTYAQKNSIEVALFGGDMFHSRSVLHTDVYNVIQDELEKWFPIQVYMIPGNHDYADRKGKIHSLRSLSKFPHLHVIDTVTSRVVRSRSKEDLLHVYAVPYTDDPKEAQANLKVAGTLSDVTHDKALPRLLLAHLGMKGATVGSDYVLESQSDIQREDVPHDKFDICLFGHYHQHQQLFDNGWFIGATHHHNWGDANTKRGFLHLSWEDRTSVRFKQVEIKTTPKFIKISDKTRSAAPTPREQDFVKFIVSKTNKMPENLKGSIEVLEIPDEDKISLEINEDLLDPFKAIEAWVDASSGDTTLKKLGESFLKRAMGKES